MLCHLNYSSFVIKLESNFIIKKVIISLCDMLGQIREGYTCSELIFKSSLELKVTSAEAIMAEIQHSSSEILQPKSSLQEHSSGSMDLEQGFWGFFWKLYSCLALFAK